MPRALLAGSKALAGAASGRLLLGASRITGRVLKSLYSAALSSKGSISLWLRSSLHFTSIACTPSGHRTRGDNATTIIRDPGNAAPALPKALFPLPRLMTNLQYLSNSVTAAPRPSLLPQTDKCRSHPLRPTNLDRARQTRRGATHALILPPLCHDMPDEAWC